MSRGAVRPCSFGKPAVTGKRRVTVTNKSLPRTSLEPVCLALADVIRQRREARGLSLSRLAELTRLSRQMIAYVETNERVPTIDTVARIGRAFGVSCSRLVVEAERRIAL